MLLVTIKSSRLVRHYRVGIASAGHPATPMPDGNVRLASVLAHIQAVLAGLAQGEGQVGRIDFVIVIVVQMAHTQDERSLGQAYLRITVIELQKGDARFRPESKGSRSHVHLGARI